MHDGGKIIAGLVIFLLLATFPIWYTAATGKSDYVPELEYPVGEQNQSCVESKDYMLANHMDLIDEWRDRVVRGGERIHISADGTHHEMSLSRTCLGCHTNKAAFCDRCHDYLGVDPYCWDCHVEPGGE